MDGNGSRYAANLESESATEPTPTKARRSKAKLVTIDVTPTEYAFLKAYRRCLKAEASGRVPFARVLELAQEASEKLNMRINAGEWKVSDGKGGSKPTLGIATGIYWNVIEGAVPRTRNVVKEIWEKWFAEHPNGPFGPRPEQKNHLRSIKTTSSPAFLPRAKAQGKAVAA